MFNISESMKTKTKKLKSIIAIFLALVLVLGFYTDTFAQSLGDLQREIERLNEDISDSEKQIQELREKEDTLQNRLAILNAEASQLQSEINRTERQIKDVQAEIKQKEEELDRTKELIQENAKILYKQGNPSTIEVLFSSENFTDFINRREYLDRVKASLNDAAKEAVAIKEDLEEKESDLEVKSSELNMQKRQLSSRQDEQRRLIAETRGQEARYQELVAQQQKDLKEARRRLAQELAARQSNIVSGGTGGYPYANVSPWSFNMCYPDPWGMCQRHCTSYTAWKVHADYLAGKVRFNMPNWGGFGNAHQWIGNAQNMNIPTGSTPKVGAVAIDPNVGCVGGTCYGHTMYVEEVLSSNTIRISQYNALTDSAGNFTGTYSEATVNTSGLTFIYFQDW